MRISSGLKLFQNVTFGRYLWGLIATTGLILVVFISSLNDAALLNSTRIVIRDALSPVMQMLQYVSHSGTRLTEETTDFFTAYKQAKQLRAENAELKRWKHVALSLMSENKALRKQVNAIPEDRIRSILTARVLTYPSQTAKQRIIIQAGAKDGVLSGQSVITAEGLIGRVIEVGNNAAEVLLITDNHSKVPVIIEPSHQQAILAGSEGKFLLLEHLESEQAVAPGMQVFTSGKGGIFPPGLFIGVTQEHNSQCWVESALKWKDLEYVQVLKQPEIRVDE